MKPAVLEDNEWKDDALATIIGLAGSQSTVTADDLSREMRRPPVTGNIYMHDFHAPTVQAFVTEFSTVCPLTLVTRTWDGDTHGPWLDQLLEGSK